MKVAITGGIGAGKSFVCKKLQAKGISVYDCDAAAKRLMATDREMQKQLSELVGTELWEGGRLNKALLSKFITESEANAQKINEIVHPAVAKDFEESGLNVLESAILFESGFNKRVNFDLIVCVTAPLETRIARIIERDNITEEQALSWIRRQMSQEEKAGLSDIVIDNSWVGDWLLGIGEEVATPVSARALKVYA